MRIEFWADDKKDFSVHIPSLKKARTYILNLFAKRPEYTHAVYNGRSYKASDIYGRF